MRRTEEERNDGALAVVPNDGSVLSVGDGGGAVVTQGGIPLPGERLTGVEVGVGNHLPHWTIGRAIYHVCFRLFDSVPASKLAEWESERANLKLQQQAGGVLSSEEIARLKYLYSEKVEKYLDSGWGSCLLRNDGALAVVKETLLHDNGSVYHLHAYGIMPNHVHVAVEINDRQGLAQIVQAWKSVSAHRINRLLGRRGELWQADYYNHIIRTAREYAFQMEYVYRNDLLCSWRWGAPSLRRSTAGAPSLRRGNCEDTILSH